MAQAHDDSCSGQVGRRDGTLSASDIAELQAAMQAVIGGIDRVSKGARDRKESNIGSATVTVNAGPAGGWVAAGVCALAAAFMAGALMIGAAWHIDSAALTRQEIAELKQRDRAHDAYINAAFRRKEEN